ncbi:MAG: hypothetical protein II784_02370, partial [Oscillospiraceae bacterium]|nr:hypothetical protein [Oscillospiraceae bacterium]
MKKISSSKAIIKLAVCLAICAAALGIGVGTGMFDSVQAAFRTIHFSWNALIRLIIMIALVLAAEHLIIFILSLIKTNNRRANTVISIVSNALKYVAAIVI